MRCVPKRQGLRFADGLPCFAVRGIHRSAAEGQIQEKKGLLGVFFKNKGMVFAKARPLRKNRPFFACRVCMSEV
jgi:hypothetical protein